MSDSLNDLKRDDMIERGELVRCAVCQSYVTSKRCAECKCGRAICEECHKITDDCAECALAVIGATDTEPDLESLLDEEVDRQLHVVGDGD